MNKYIFSGNLGRDAEVRYTSGGKAVCSFSVAVKAGYGDNEKTEWVKCSLFGKRAEGGLVQYLVKGQQVIVEGEPTADAWNDKQSGEAKGCLYVFVKDVELVGGKGKADDSQGRQSAPQQQPAPQQNQQGASGPDDFSDEIPFLPYQRRTIA